MLTAISRINADTQAQLTRLKITIVGVVWGNARRVLLSVPGEGDVWFDLDSILDDTAPGASLALWRACRCAVLPPTRPMGAEEVQAWAEGEGYPTPTTDPWGAPWEAGQPWAKFAGRSGWDLGDKRVVYPPRVRWTRTDFVTA